MRAAQAESARFVATHIAPGLAPDQEDALSMRILVCAARPGMAPRLSALIPTIDPSEVAHINKDMYVRHFTLGDGTDQRTVRVSMENTMLKYRLYDTKTNRAIQLPIEQLSRRLSAIGYRRYENQFSKLAIRSAAEMRGTISLHKSGKVLVTATANVDVARYLARVYVPCKLLPKLGLAHIEARNEVLSNIVVKMETPYTFSPHLMARDEEDISYDPAHFSSAMLKNLGLATGSRRRSEIATHTKDLVANELALRFHEPTLPRRKWAISFFKPSRALFVGLTHMEDIEPMMRVADAIAYRYRYEHPPNRIEEDALAATYTRKRKRSGRVERSTKSLHKKAK